MILRSMRNGFFSALFLALLVLGGFSLVLTDWNGMFRDGGIAKTDVAVVNGTPIKIAEFNTLANRILRNQRIDPSRAYEMGVIDNILQSEILSRVLALAAHDYGISVEDKHVARQISALISPLVTKESDPKQALQQFLKMQGMSEKDLVRTIRHEMETELLKATIASSVYVPQILQHDISSYRGMTRTVKYVELKNTDIKIGNTIDEATLKEYYKGIETQYMIPESRDFSVAIFDVSEALKNVSASDEEIESYYQSHQDEYAVPEKRALEQAVLQTESEAQALMEKAATYKNLANAVKDQTGDTKAFIDQMSFAESDLTPEMSAPVFGAKAHDLVGPIKTPLGFHVIRVTAIEAPHTKPLDEVKDQIKQQLIGEKVGNDIYKVTSAIEDRLAGGDSFADLEKDYKLEILNFKDVTVSGDPLKTDGKLDETQKEKIREKAFQMTAGEASSLSDLTATSFYSVRVEQIHQTKPEPFDTVKDKIAKRWTEENQARVNLGNAQELVEKLNTNPDDTVLKTYNFKTIDTLGQTSDAFGDPRVTGRFMEAPEGKYILAVPADASSVFVGVASGTKLGTPSGKPDEQLAAMLKSDAATANLMMFVSYLESKYPVTVNDGLLKRIYGKSSDEE